MSSQFLNFSIKAPGGGNLDPEDDDNYCDIPNIGLRAAFMFNKAALISRQS